MDSEKIRKEDIKCPLGDGYNCTAYGKPCSYVSSIGCDAVLKAYETGRNKGLELIMEVFKPYLEKSESKKCGIVEKGYSAIRKSVSTWPKWKKDLCNKELLVSSKSKKI